MLASEGSTITTTPPPPPSWQAKPLSAAQPQQRSSHHLRPHEGPVTERYGPTRGGLGAIARYEETAWCLPGAPGDTGGHEGTRGDIEMDTQGHTGDTGPRDSSCPPAFLSAPEELRLRSGHRGLFTGLFMMECSGAGLGINLT